MRYLAADVTNALIAEGCTFEGDRFGCGTTWLTRDCQVFQLPDPDLIEGKHWHDADVIDDILANRWAGFSLHLTRYK